MEMDMRIVSIDLSLRSTGVAIFDEETNEMKHLVFIRKDLAKPKVLLELSTLGVVYWIHETSLEMITNILNVVNPTDRIVCEGLSYNSNSSSSLDLAKAQGMLLYGASLKGLREIEFVAPKTIKKFATGNGNASKENMFNRYLVYNPGSGFKNSKPFEDIIDAVFLNLYVQNSLY